MAMPKAPYSYEMALAQQPKGFHFNCTGCKESFTVYPKAPKDMPFTYKCWCGGTKTFYGSEFNAAAV